LINFASILQIFTKILLYQKCNFSTWSNGSMMTKFDQIVA